MSQPKTTPIKATRHEMDNESISEKLLDDAGAVVESTVLPVAGFKCAYQIWGNFTATWKVLGRLHPDAPFAELATGTAAKVPTELPYPVYEVKCSVTGYSSGNVNGAIYGERHR